MRSPWAISSAAEQSQLSQPLLEWQMFCLFTTFEPFCWTCSSMCISPVLESSELGSALWMCPHFLCPAGNSVVCNTSLGCCITKGIKLCQYLQTRIVVRSFQKYVQHSALGSTSQHEAAGTGCCIISKFGYEQLKVRQDKSTLSNPIPLHDHWIMALIIKLCWTTLWNLTEELSHHLSG